MHVNYINNYNPNFKSSQLNILATSDNHGNLATMPQLIKTVVENREDIFYKSEEPSTLNLFAVAGDFFNYPEKTGLMTQKDTAVGDLQYKFLEKMIQTFHFASGKNSNFETVFALGNHDLEAGDKWIMNRLKDAPLTTVITNVNLSKSPLIKKIMEEHENIVTSKMYEIPDDTRPDIKNHVLILGLTIPREKFNGKKMEGTQFYDTLNKNESLIEHTDFEKTYRVIDFEIEKYKAVYPNGAVVLMSHLGNPISNMIAKEVPDIDLILNAHDHEEYDKIINDTLISSLGENNKFVKSINIKFDDYGKIETIDKKKFKTKKYAKIAEDDENLQKFVYYNLRKDLTPILKMDIKENLTKQLKYSKDIRSSNSIFVNYVTSGIKETARLAYPSLDFVGIPSKVFRGGLTNENGSDFNNLDLIKLFGGANPNLSELKIGEVTGIELSEIIIENTLKNIEKPKEAGIIHWSDIQVNRTLIEEIKSGQNELHYIDAIKIKNQETKDFEQIDKYKTYTIMLPNKYLFENLNNSQIKMNFINRFVYVNDTYTNLFKEYLDLVDHHLVLSNETLEKRII